MPEAEAVHARVDLEMTAEHRGVARRGLLQRGRRGRRGNRRRQRVREEAVEVADAERAEHQNRGADAGVAQRDPLLDIRAREHGRPRALEREADFPRAVAVGVRLDDTDDSRTRRRPR